MSEQAAARSVDPDELRARILADPGIVLGDDELMRAILKAERSGLGRNVVDLRGVLVDRLEERLDRLEDTHREVIAAAYDNVSGTNQVHRACLALLGEADFGGFLAVMSREAPRILGVEMIRLGLEAPTAEPGRGLGPEGLQDVVVALPRGGAAAYATAGRGGLARRVVLRPLRSASPALYGEAAGAIRSEAVLSLDLGPQSLPAVLVLGSVEAERFSGEQGTDLLEFLAGVLERALRRFLG